MSSPRQPEQVKGFRGKSGAECEKFIQSIRKAAWKEGKLQDSLWMANFASLHFSGKALKWHSDLAPDVRQDWFKQEKALLERWPSPPDDSDNEAAESSIIPPPAAPSALLTQPGKSSNLGILQVVPKSGNWGPRYIARPDDGGECRLTTEVSEALLLRWNRSVGSEAHLEWVDSGSKWLAIHWVDHDLSFGHGSLMWARLTVVNPGTLTPATSGYSPTSRPFRTNIWQLTSGGQTTVVWHDFGRAIELEVFMNEGYVFIVVDPEAYQEANPDERRGHFIFKPIG